MAEVALDLVVLTPGEAESWVVEALLSQRHVSLGIRRIRFRVLKHRRHDPGCFRESVQFLRDYQLSARHALVLFDHEGSGKEATSALEVASDVRGRLAAAGWADRADAVVLVPELEVWVWSDSPELDRALGWPVRGVQLRDWLCERGWLAPGEAKPRRPKEALETALDLSRFPRSADLYEKIALTVGLNRCTDPSFLTFKSIITRWFGEAP
ncbi:MAG TPA: hypothetical protein VEZ11_18540 [Thermoanaerobaculia bacterium]|nr:hypothetical protein [Thermoanaerobaculia bacterium]